MKIAAMQLIKTLRARDALQDRESALSTRQRQILILADGQRTSAQDLCTKRRKNHRGCSTQTLSE